LASRSRPFLFRLIPSVVIASQTLGAAFDTLTLRRIMGRLESGLRRMLRLKTTIFQQRWNVAAASAAVILLLIGFNSSVEAQIFCPTSAGPGQPGVTLQSGFCTNGHTGALSTAALSSQSLSEVTETTTQQSTTSTLKAVENRRNEEAQRCPNGFERVGGNCRRIAERSSEPPPRTAGSTMSTISSLRV
jgi:hypothetical protein